MTKRKQSACDWNTIVDSLTLSYSFTGEVWEGRGEGTCTYSHLCANSLQIVFDSQSLCLCVCHVKNLINKHDSARTLCLCMCLCVCVCVCVCTRICV